MTEKIREAIQLLRQNDYLVIKLSANNKKDIAQCCELGDKKDCTCCSCSVCLINI